MGCGQSKEDAEGAVARCREQKNLLRAAVEARHGLSGAHAAHAAALRNVGAALSDYASGEAHEGALRHSASAAAVMSSSGGAGAQAAALALPPPPPPPGPPEDSPALVRSMSAPDLPPPAGDQEETIRRGANHGGGRRGRGPAPSGGGGPAAAASSSASDAPAPSHTRPRPPCLRTRGTRRVPGMSSFSGPGTAYLSRRSRWDPAQPPRGKLSGRRPLRRRHRRPIQRNRLSFRLDRQRHRRLLKKWPRERSQRWSPWRGGR
nr:protein ROLLING AND ERECT LEAF 2-like [Lolium perenne]